MRVWRSFLEGGREMRVVDFFGIRREFWVVFCMFFIFLFMRMVTFKEIYLGLFSFWCKIQVIWFFSLGFYFLQYSGFGQRRVVRRFRWRFRQVRKMGKRLGLGGIQFVEQIRLEFYRLRIQRGSVYWQLLLMGV